MKIIKANIWNYKDKGTIIIPTNGFVKKNGECVMGRGLALQAKQRYPDLPFLLGQHIKTHGNTIGYFYKYDLISFPVKHNWWEQANLELIEHSAIDLGKKYIEPYNLGCNINLYMPRIGCGNGKLEWGNVLPIIYTHLGHLVTIVDII